MKEKSVIPINQEEISSYLKDIRKLTVMTPERERELAERMLSNDITPQEKDSIKKELLEGNLRFVISVSKQYQNQGLTHGSPIHNAVILQKKSSGVLGSSDFSIRNRDRK